MLSPSKTVPPSTSEIDGNQSITLAEVMDAINQLSQAVSSQISQTNTELASLRNEIEASIGVVRNDLDTRKNKVAAVRDEIVSLTELIKKGRQDMAEEAMVLAVKKRKREDDKRKEKEEKKRREEEIKKEKNVKKKKRLRKNKEKRTQSQLLFKSRDDYIAVMFFF